MLIATENNVDCIPNDPTGWRRFPVIPVKKSSSDTVGDIVAKVEMDREQLWAEARYRYEQGERVYLRGDLERQAIELGKSHCDRDDIYEDYVVELEGEGPADSRPGGVVRIGPRRLPRE